MHHTVRTYIETQLFTPSEAAEFTGLSEDAIHQRAWRGTLDFVKKGKGKGILLFHRSDLEKIKVSNPAP